MRKLAAAAIAAPLGFMLAIGGMTLVAIGAPGASFGAGLRPGALPDKATPYIPWIEKAGSLCPEVTPGIIAAQLNAESGFDPNATSGAGAVGIAQFLPATFVTYGRDDDGTGNVSPTNPADEIMAQGRYMCDLVSRAKKSGYSGGTIQLALAGYNAGWDAVQRYGGIPPYQETTSYISEIMTNAANWSAAAPPGVDGTGTGPDAVRRAAQFIGTPYVWGGGTPGGPSIGYCDGTNGYLGGECFASTHSGFDCSGLTQYAYWPSTQLPRTADEQYSATASRPVSRDQLQVGDLLFWSHGGVGGIYHVAMYYGNGQIIEAPRTGQSVKVVPIDEAMPSGDYYGATRPA